MWRSGFAIFWPGLRLQSKNDLPLSDSTKTHRMTARLTSGGLPLKTVIIRISPARAASGLVMRTRLRFPFPRSWCARGLRMANCLMVCPSCLRRSASGFGPFCTRWNIAMRRPLRDLLLTRRRRAVLVVTLRLTPLRSDWLSRRRGLLHHCRGRAGGNPRNTGASWIFVSTNGLSVLPLETVRAASMLGGISATPTYGSEALLSGWDQAVAGRSGAI